MDLSLKIQAQTRKSHSGFYIYVFQWLIIPSFCMTWFQNQVLSRPRIWIFHIPWLPKFFYEQYEPWLNNLKTFNIRSYICASSAVLVSSSDAPRCAARHFSLFKCHKPTTLRRWGHFLLAEFDFRLLWHHHFFRWFINIDANIAIWQL